MNSVADPLFSGRPMIVFITVAPGPSTGGGGGRPTGYSAQEPLINEVSRVSWVASASAMAWGGLQARCPCPPASSGCCGSQHLTSLGC